MPTKLCRQHPLPTQNTSGFIHLFCMPVCRHRFFLPQDKPFSTDGLSTQVITPSATFLTISWTLEETLTATGYTISYYNTNNIDCFTDSRSGITTSGTSYSLTGLEEGTEYSITVTATLTGGRTEQHTVTSTTRTAGQSISQSTLTSF